jgi:hypothetical protein
MTHIRVNYKVTRWWWLEQQRKEMIRLMDAEGFSPKEAADLVEPPYFYFVEHHTGRTNQYDNEETGEIHCRLCKQQVYTDEE